MRDRIPVDNIRRYLNYKNTDENRNFMFTMEETISEDLIEPPSPTESDAENGHIYLYLDGFLDDNSFFFKS